MAITGSGFDGTMNEAAFAKLMQLAGARYVVGGMADFAATQVSGVRSISISAGNAYAPGVLVTSTAAEVMAFSAPTAGQWHLIVLRRTWSTNVCELVAVAGITTANTTPTAPPTLYPTINSTPGVIDDQPLWWAWVNVSTTEVTRFDVRNPLDTGWITPTLNSGWTNTSLVYRRLNGVTYIQGRAATTGATATAFTLPGGFQPDATRTFLLDSTGSAVRSWVTSTGVVGQVAATAQSALDFGGCPSYIAATA